MKKNPPAAIAALAAKRPALADATIKEIRDKCAKARDLQKEIADLDERLTAKKNELDDVLRKEIPDALDAAGTKSFTLVAEGNLPELEVKVEPFYSASIAKSWAPEKRKAAFAYLESLGAGDLIKTVVSVAFKREEQKDVQEFIDLAEDQGFETEKEEAVHASTLKSWLKERTEKHQETTDLEKIGGIIGRIAKLKEKNS